MAENSSVTYLREVAMDKVDQGDYSLALYYLEVARSIDSDSGEVVRLIDEIKDKYEDSVKGGYSKPDKERPEKAPETEAKPEPIAKKQVPKPAVEAQPPRPAMIGRPPVEDRPLVRKRRLDSGNEEQDFDSSRVKDGQVLDLDALSEDAFPFPVDVAPGHAFEVRSAGLKRFLSTDSEKLAIERVDESTIRVKAVNFAKSVPVHVWNVAGRRTLAVSVTMPRIRIAPQKDWDDARGFRFNYRTGWSSFYRGDSVDVLKKQSSTLTHGLSVRGPVPIGDFDASVSWSQANGNTDLNSLTMGIDNGHLGFLQDFEFRTFDIGASLSDYTLAGASMRGYWFHTPLADGKYEYTVFHGKEIDSIYGTLSGGITEGTIDSYIQGIRLGYHPDEDNDYYFNFGHVYGEESTASTNDKAFSLETFNRFENASMDTEFATDQDHFAGNVQARFSMPRSSLSMKIENTEKGYTPLNTSGGNSGRQSFNLAYSAAASEKLSLVTSLQLYRDLTNFNPDKEHYPNYMLNGSLAYTIDEVSAVNNTLYYSASPNQLFSTRTFSNVTGYNRTIRLKLLPQDVMYSYLSNTFQRSSYPSSPESSYWRDSLSLGLRLPVTQDLSFNTGYSISYAKGLITGESSQPMVFDAGLDYRYQITPRISSSYRLSYRNEEKTEGSYNFTSGSDSVDGSVTVNFRLNPDTSLYCGGSLRRVWAERESVAEYVYGSVRAGGNISWDSFITWAPRTTVRGYVFRDMNGNGVYDETDQGLSGITVALGPMESVTADSGYFEARVRASRVLAHVDINTVPKGFVFTTPTAVEVDTAGGGVRDVYFGVSPHSGISGIAFVDVNGNNRVDRADTPVPGVRLILNGGTSVTTNGEGLYTFNQAGAGVHTVMLDLSSVPMEYLPNVPIKQQVEVIDGLTAMFNVPLVQKDGK